MNESLHATSITWLTGCGGGGRTQSRDIALKNDWLMKLTAVTLWASGLYALVGCWKHCCFIAPLLSVMSLIKFSSVVVWRLFEDKYFSACSGVLTRAKSEKKSISVPDASANLDCIFLWRCVCRRGEIGVRTAASGICKQIATQYTRLSTVRGYVGTSCLCHWAFRPVIKLLSAARPRPLGLNSEHAGHQGQAMREADLTRLLSYCTSTFIHKHLRACHRG